MKSFAEQLKATRQLLGYKQARPFYNSLKDQGISFNYSYYMRLEQGKVLPSEKVVNEIAQGVGEKEAEALVQCYCRSLFPRFSYLFSHYEVEEAVSPMKEPATAQATKQKELSEKQIACLAAHEIHYHLFLLFTLSRNPIRPEQLTDFVNKQELSKALANLEKQDFLRLTEKGYEAMAVESKFPEAHNKELKKAYALFDTWDISFGEKYGLESVLNKMLIRRVSFRYIGIIRKQLEVLFELVKSSDEMDTRYNEKVIQLRVQLRQGRLPG